MGRLATIVVLLIASATTAFAEDAIDPTVWSKDQWRSDLFHTYSTHRAAPARTVVHQVVIEKTVMTGPDYVWAQIAAAAVPVRPKLLVIGDHAGDNRVSVQHPGHGCDGVLTLTWMGDHAEPKCSRSQSRILRTGP
jgi:hypothetical protein